MSSAGFPLVTQGSKGNYSIKKNVKGDPCAHLNLNKRHLFKCIFLDLPSHAALLLLAHTFVIEIRIFPYRHSTLLPLAADQDVTRMMWQLVAKDSPLTLLMRKRKSLSTDWIGSVCKYVVVCAWAHGYAMVSVWSPHLQKLLQWSLQLLLPRPHATTVFELFTSECECLHTVLSEIYQRCITLWP